MKILFFTMPYAGHIYPNVPLLKEIQSREMELVIFGSKEHLKGLLDDDSVEYVDLPEYIVEFCKIGGKASVLTDNFVEQYFSYIYDENLLKTKAYQENALQQRFYEEFNYLLNQLNPDCILYDSYAFYIKKILSDNTYKCIEVNCAISIANNYQDSDSWKEYVENIVLKEVENAPSLDKIKLVKNRMDRFVKRFEPKSDLNKNKVSYFSYHCKLLQNDDSMLTSSHKYLGYDMMNSYELVKDGSIFVSRGTMSEQYGIKLLQETIDSLVGLDKIINVSLGKNEDAENILKNKRYQNNISILSYVNQVEYLSKASIFITHGGITGVREAVLCKTPMIVIPANYLDYQVGKALEKAGAGILIKTRPSFKEELIQAIDSINFDMNKYIEGVDKIAKQLRDNWNNSGIAQVLDVINS